jgi:hypothetical protein
MLNIVNNFYFSSRLRLILTMAYNTRNYWVSGLYPWIALILRKCILGNDMCANKHLISLKHPK